MIRIYILCFFAFCVSGKVIPDPKDCGSKSGKIDELNVTPCDDLPCKLPRGKNATISIKITANEQIKNATTKVTAIVGPAHVPYSVPDPNACHFMTCPIAPETTETYTTAMFVDKNYPKIRLVVKWEIVDQDTNDLICFEVPIEVID